MPPAGEADHRLSGRQQIIAYKKSEGASCGGNPRLHSTAPAYRGVLGVVVEVLLLELLFDGLVGLLGFIPLLPEPGVLDVSVVEPVVGAAGRDWSPPDPVVPVEPVADVEPVPDAEPVPDVEPLVLPEVDPVVLEEPLAAPGLDPLALLPSPPRELASVEVEWRVVSIGLRPLARWRDFIEPCWLQSHLQSFPDESLPMVSVDAVSRDVPVDIPVLRSDVVADDEVEPLFDVVLLDASEPLLDVVLLDASERGVLLSLVELLSLLLVAVEPD